MESRRTKTIVLGGCALMLCAVLSGPLAEETEAPILGLTDAGFCEETARDLIIGGSCLPSTAINCSMLPIPVGGSCSCTAEVLEERCKSCDPRYKGVVLQTTCTIRPAPCTGNCGIQEVIRRTGRSCVRTL